MAENSPDGNGWPEYRREVMAALGGLKDSLGKLDDKLDKTRLDVAGLKVKAAIWGGAAGAVPAILLLLWQVYRGGK